MTAIKHSDRSRVAEARRLLAADLDDAVLVEAMRDLLEPPPLPEGASWEERRMHDTVSFGWGVLAVNMHGVLVALGPYDETQMHDVAHLAARLCGPVWTIDLDQDLGERGMAEMSRYGTDETGTSIEQPEHDPPRLTAPVPAQEGDQPEPAEVES